MERERTRMKEDQYKTHEKFDNRNHLTIWDLPTDINKKELEYICRKFEKAQIVRIKMSKYKALAVVQVERTDKNTSWAIPVDNNKLVRVTRGIEDHEAREEQRKYTAKLTELPKSASEILLLRSLRSKGAKSVHIPPNRNGNQRSTATIMFATERDMKAAQSKPFMFNNFRLYWVKEREREVKRRGSFKEDKGKSWEEFGQNPDAEEESNEENEQENKIYINKIRNIEDPKIENYASGSRNILLNQDAKIYSEHRSVPKVGKEKYEKKTVEVKAQIQKEVPFAEDILRRILERLERLEETRERAWENLANRS